jgi:hypothetical protein
MPKRKINGRAVAQDVLDGLGDTVLMQKYSLTAKQLESVLKRLVDMDLISHMQMYERTSLSDSMVTKAFVETRRAIEELN